MPRSRHEFLVLGGALLTLVFVGGTMYRWSYDVWAGVVIAPVLLLAMLPIARRILGQQFEYLVPIVLIGFVFKLAGSCTRYFVVFDAYGKNGDAERYFDVGSEIASKVRDGRASLVNLLPLARDTAFIERVSGAVLTVLGPTRLGGFFVFSTFAYIGTICIIRAACMAIPRLSSRRYATLCALAPSLAFWPSSLGKEAWVIGCVGFLSLGVAKILTWQGRGAGWMLLLLAAFGIGVVRPHFAAIFVGAATVSIAFSAVFPTGPVNFRKRGSVVLFALFAGVGLVLASQSAVRYLDTGDSATGSGVFGSVGSILQRTTEQTNQGGSSFVPMNIDSPIRWPYAIARTLTRPWPQEVTNIATMLPSIETTLYLMLLVLCWRRTSNILTVMRRSAYLVYAVVATVGFGLAFTAISNLGILVRQRSIVVPFLLVILCLPQRGTPLDEETFEKSAVYA